MVSIAQKDEGHWVATLNENAEEVVALAEKEEVPFFEKCGWLSAFTAGRLWQEAEKRASRKEIGSHHQRRRKGEKGGKGDHDRRDHGKGGHGKGKGKGRDRDHDERSMPPHMPDFRGGGPRGNGMPDPTFWYAPFVEFGLRLVD